MEDVTRQTVFDDKCEWIILNVNPPEDNFEEEIILKYAEKHPNIVYQRLRKTPAFMECGTRQLKCRQASTLPM